MGYHIKIKDSPEDIDDDSGNFKALYLPKDADHFKVYELINNYEGKNNNGNS